MGCEKSPRDKLQGEWDGVSIDNCPPGEVAHATSWVKGTAFTFTGNKVKVTIPAESPQSGSWKIAKADPTGMTLTFLREDGTSYGEAELKMVGERELRWNIGNGREVVMQKKM
jgi:hypothetical protein